MQITISGTFFCRFNGMRYDARYVVPDSGSPASAHSFLELSPRLRLVKGDPIRHRYVYEVAPGRSADPWIRLNTDRFVDQLLITPSEVVASLNGALRCDVLVPGRPSAAWPAGLVLLLIGGLGLRPARRLDADLRACLAELRAHCRETLRGLPKDIRRVSRIPARLRQVSWSCRSLARQIQDLRNTISRMEHGRRQVIEELERTSAYHPQAGSDFEKTLAARRSLLDTVDQMRQSHARLWGRLQRVVASLADYHLKVERMAQLEMESDIDPDALEEVSAELGALDTTLRQIKGMERKGSIWC